MYGFIIIKSIFKLVLCIKTKFFFNEFKSIVPSSTCAQLKKYLIKDYITITKFGKGKSKSEKKN